MRQPSIQYVSPLLLTLLIASSALAQNQNNAAPSFRGIVIGAADDSKSFTIVDRSGRIVAMPVTSTTTFEANGAQVNFAGAIVFGMEVRGNLAADGSAASVSARGQATEVRDEQLQAFMGVADDEWAILKPKIDRVQALKRIVEGRGGGGNGNGGNAVALRNPVQDLQRTLRSSFFNPSISAAQLRSNLNALRQEQARANAELDRVRQELLALITTRQEVLLVMMEILE